MSDQPPLPAEVALLACPGRPETRAVVSTWGAALRQLDGHPPTAWPGGAGG